MSAAIEFSFYPDGGSNKERVATLAVALALIKAKAESRPQRQRGWRARYWVQLIKDGTESTICLVTYDPRPPLGFSLARTSDPKIVIEAIPEDWAILLGGEAQS